MGLYQENLFAKLKQEESSIERFRLIAELLEDGCKPWLIARKCGLKDYTVRHYARLHRNLDESVKELFTGGKISFSLVRAIAGLPKKQQESAARKAISKHTSVQSFRSALKQTDDNQLARELIRLSDQLSSISGLAIDVVADKGSSQAGRVVIRYTDLSMFDVIMDRLTGGRSLDEF
jgi:hypothetical protein